MKYMDYTQFKALIINKDAVFKEKQEIIEKIAQEFLNIVEQKVKYVELFEEKLPSYYGKGYFNKSLKNIKHLKQLHQKAYIDRKKQDNLI